MARGRNRKGQFTKRSTALVRRKSSSVTHRRGYGRRRRRSGGGGTGVTLAKVIAAGVVVGYVFADGAPADSMRAKARSFFANDIPGGKTFGPAATVGAAALLVDRFLYRNPWVRGLGYLGVGLAAVKLGQQGTDFKWLGEGDDGDNFVADVDG